MSTKTKKNRKSSNIAGTLNVPASVKKNEVFQVQAQIESNLEIIAVCLEVICPDTRKIVIERDTLGLTSILKTFQFIMEQDALIGKYVYRLKVINENAEIHLLKVADCVLELA